MSINTITMKAITLMLLSAQILLGVPNELKSTDSTKVFDDGGITKLTVYTDIPGWSLSPTPIKSTIYGIRVRSVASNYPGAPNNGWVECFTLFTKNRANEVADLPDSNNYVRPTVRQGYLRHTADWTQAYANIEMSEDTPVEVEIRKIGNTLLLNGSSTIVKSAVHPAQKVTLDADTINDGETRVYFTIANPGQFVIDINGQMDDHNSVLNPMSGDPPVHSVTLFANPLMVKPDPGAANTISIASGQAHPPENALNTYPASSYQTMIFQPGVHRIGQHFNIHPGKTYYIPGDAIVFGTLNNLDAVKGTFKSIGDSITIRGYGTLNGTEFPHSDWAHQYPDLPDAKAYGNRGIVVEFATNFLMEGLTIADPPNFATSIEDWPGRSPMVMEQTIRWSKAITWKANGDGFGGTDLIEDSFMRTNDDSTYVTGIRRRCTMWKDGAAHMFRIPKLPQAGTTFPYSIEDCDVIYHRSREGTTLGAVFQFDEAAGTGVINTEFTIRDIRFHDRRSNRPVFNLVGEPSYTGLKFENIGLKKPLGGHKENKIEGLPNAIWGPGINFKNVTYDNGTSTVELNRLNFATYFNVGLFTDIDGIVFGDSQNYTLTVNADGAQGSVARSPNLASYPQATFVTLTAVPKPDFLFTGWTGVDPAEATNNPLTIRMLENQNITANFSPLLVVSSQLTTVGTHNWICPPGVTNVTVECWGGGGAAGSVRASGTIGSSTEVRGGGGAGGSYARRTSLTVTPGATYKVVVGAGGLPITAFRTGVAESIQTGGVSRFTDASLLVEYVKAVGGVGGSNANKTSGPTSQDLVGGLGSPSGCIGDVVFAGGNGANGGQSYGGGGGGGAGDAGTGGNASEYDHGLGGVVGGGAGADGREFQNATASPGMAPGGGGGGTYVIKPNQQFGGAGARGEVRVSYIGGFSHFAVTASAQQTAGIPFDVTITAQDVNNATVFRSLKSLTVTSPGGSFMEFDWNGDGIYGDNSGLFLNGVKTLKARNKKAETATIVAAVENFTTTTPPSVTTIPGAFAKLQILAPGETAAPGTVSGKGGTANSVGLSLPFAVTVHAVDEFWNFVSGVTDMVRITSSDPTATLPANAPLVSGTRTFEVRLNTLGNYILTATDLTDGTKAPAISSALTVQGYTWIGDGLANRWSTNPSVSNWTNPMNAIVAFNDGNQAVFNDSSPNRVVDIDGVVAPGAIWVDSSGNYTISSTSGGSISGATGLIKDGTGTLTLASANTYNGNTVINAGILRAANNGAFGNSLVFLNNTGATLELANGITLNRSLTIGDLGDKKTLALQPGATSAIYSGTITNSETTIGNSEILVGAAGALTLSGTVSSNTIAKAGAGTLVLSGATNNSSLLLDATAGEVQLGKDSSGSINAVFGIRRIANGATVRLTGSGNNQISGGNGANQSVNGLEAGGTLNLNGRSESVSFLTGSNATLGNAGTGGVVDGGSGTVTLTVGESNVSSWFPGQITDTSGTLNLVKIGSGTQTLTGSHSYSGTTEIRSGALTLTFADNCLPSSTTVVLGSGTSSGTLRLGSSNAVTPPFPGTASDQTIAGLTTSGSGMANAVIGGKSDTISTLTLNNSTDVVYGGKLGGTDITSNNLALTKTGAGTFTLTGTRTYTGPTNVQAGTLALVGGTHASPITVTSGGSLGFTLGTPATSTAAVNLTSGTVKVTGTVDNVSSYKLMTAASFTGPFTLSPAIPNYELRVQGVGNTELWLVPLVTLTTNAVNGSVTLSPAGGSYNLGTAVLLTAMPDPGYRFNGWSGDLTGSTNPATLVMDGNKSVTATFIPGVTLSTSAVNGSITLNPPGGTYDIGTEVTVTAVANSNYQFAGWSGELGGNANPSTVVMDGNKSITATFVELQISDFTTVGSHNWVCPPGVTHVTVECWGGGGAAGSATSIATGNTQARSGGGAGGSYAGTTNLEVTPGAIYKVIVGAGGNPISTVATHNTALEGQNGGESKITNEATTELVKAIGGAGGRNALKSSSSSTVNVIGGVGSTDGCIGVRSFPGGNGGNAGATSVGGTGAGGGGGGAGNASPGGSPTFAITGGDGGTVGGGAGGTARGAPGPIQSSAGTPGGGGGGVVVSTSGQTNIGGAGGVGKVVLSYIDGLDHFGVAAGSLQTAGIPFDVTITALDASNAKVDGIVTTVTLTSPGGSLIEFDWNCNGTYGDNSGALVNGTKTIKARNKKAETVTLIAAAHALTTPAPASVTTGPAAFARLQILTSGETAAPVTASGKTGTPDNQNIGSAFNITVNAVDEFWNLVSSTDIVGITSTDPAATLPANSPLAGGTGTFALTFGTAGSFTLTATDISDGSKSADTTPALTVAGSSDPFIGWAGPGVMFDADTNNDGVDNGLAWFLGAAGESVNAADRLPKATENAGALVLEFGCLNATDRGTSVFEVQYGQLDTWAGTPIPGAVGAFSAGVVDFVITDPEPVGGLLKVVATIPVGEATAGKVFGRIKGVN